MRASFIKEIPGKSIPQEPAPDLKRNLSILMKAYGIKTVVDVRRFPASRFEHFRRENLEVFLKREGIHYVYLGDELGGYRKGGYEAYLLTGEFARGLKKLKEIGLGGPTVFVCAERLPWRCHRRFIGNALRNEGWDVVHIIEKDRVWELR